MLLHTSPFNYVNVCFIYLGALMLDVCVFNNFIFLVNLYSISFFVTLFYLKSVFSGTNMVRNTNGTKILLPFVAIFMDYLFLSFCLVWVALKLKWISCSSIMLGLFDFLISHSVYFKLITTYLECIQKKIFYTPPFLLLMSQFTSFYIVYAINKLL